jgi:hypothetical protein
VAGTPKRVSKLSQERPPQRISEDRAFLIGRGPTGAPGNVQMNYLDFGVCLPQQVSQRIGDHTIAQVIAVSFSGEDNALGVHFRSQPERDSQE